MPPRFTRKDFLEALFGRYFAKHDGFIMVKMLRQLDHKISLRYFPNVDALAKEQYSRDQNVFFGVSPRERMKPGPENIRYIVALWAGLDMGPDGFAGNRSFLAGPPHAAKAIRSFPIAPSIIVESGWGVHLYWLMREVTAVTDINIVHLVLRKIHDYFLCRSEVKIDSALRLPSSSNSKIPGHFVSCNVKYINTEFLYSLDDFVGLQLRPAIIGEDVPPVPIPRTAPAAPAGRFEPEPYDNEEDDRAGSIDEAEVKEFLARDKSRVAYLGKTPPLKKAPEPVAESPAPPAPPTPPGPKISEEYIPDEDEEDDGGIEVLSEETSDEFADQVADAVVRKIRDTLLDEIVDRLVKRLMGTKKT
jgi:hypothetical protein